MITLETEKNANSLLKRRSRYQRVLKSLIRACSSAVLDHHRICKCRFHRQSGHFFLLFFSLLQTLAKVVSAGRECDPLKVETVHLLIQLVQTKPQRTAKDRKRICRGTWRPDQQKYQIDILNSASRILQCWSYYVKINFARHQHNTERTQNRAADCSHVTAVSLLL